MIPYTVAMAPLPIPFACIAFASANRSFFASQYKIERNYEPYDPSQHTGAADDAMPLHRYLWEVDPGRFPSKSQARKAVEHGRLLVLRAADNYRSTDTETASISIDPSALGDRILDLGKVAEPATLLQDEDVVAIRSRDPDGFYPQSCTKYVDPPPNALDLMSSPQNSIVFEDDRIAVVNKPEGMDTIGAKRLDLQSALPFILHPPSEKPFIRNKRAKQCYLPRPIHRLDRRTSGCVLVAKSEDAMKQYSRLFATRSIQKSYCAIVFGEPEQDDEKHCLDVDGKAFSNIDYPIDGKDAVTLWRLVVTVTSPTWGRLSLLHLLPKTGRNHQIRRHLSYCLSCPIVGDSKYDGGGTLARTAREELGMFLCSNSMKFAHVFMEDESDIFVDIPLPDKFYDLLVLDRDEVLL